MEEGVQIGNLQIPIVKGDTGEPGDAGKIKSISVTMLSSTATAYANNIGTEHEAQIQLGIPKGVGISTVTINEDDELVVSLDNGTDLNCGVVVGLGVLSITLDEEYNFVMTLTDGTTETIGNIETSLQGILSDYYTSADVDDLLDRLIGEIKEKFGHSLSMSLNQTTYVLTIGLVDYNGDTLDTKTVDLPLESVVVSGTYDNTTKKVILTLQNGSTVEFSVADLVSGLQSEITSNNKLSADLVDDTNTTNKFVTSAEKTTWNAKVGTTDYATSSTGGVIKASTTYGLDMDSGNLRAKVWSTTGGHTFNERELIGYKTLMNILDDKIGDIDTAIDSINGEVV